MSTHSLPLPNFPSPHSLRLGYLVTNTENLYQEVHEPFPGRLAQDEYETKDQGEYSINSKSSKTSRLTPLASPNSSPSHRSGRVKRALN